MSLLHNRAKSISAKILELSFKVKLDLFGWHFLAPAGGHFLRFLVGAFWRSLVSTFWQFLVGFFGDFWLALLELSSWQFIGLSSLICLPFFVWQFLALSG